jgi:hypothetical protein
MCYLMRCILILGNSNLILKMGWLNIIQSIRTVLDFNNPEESPRQPVMYLYIGKFLDLGKTKQMGDCRNDTAGNYRFCSFYFSNSSPVEEPEG